MYPARIGGTCRFVLREGDLQVGGPGGPWCGQVAEMFECSFSFMKLPLASSHSICVSIAAANCSMALSREKSRIGMMIS